MKEVLPNIKNQRAIILLLSDLLLIKEKVRRKFLDFKLLHFFKFLRKMIPKFRSISKRTKHENNRSIQ